MIDRTRYQFGSVTLKKRAKGADVWEFRYYETQADNTRKRKATFVGTTNQYKNKSDARVAVEALLLKLNEEKPQHHLGAVTFGAICDRYIEEELPERYSTRKSYLSNIKLHIRPRWERYLLHQIRPMVVEGWLKNMDMAPKSKAHIRSVMHPDVRVRGPLGTLQRPPKPHADSSGQGRQQAATTPNRFDCAGI